MLVENNINHHVTIIAQAGLDCAGVSIQLIPQSGYDGSKAQAEAREIADTLFDSLPGPIVDMVLSGLLKRFHQLANDDGDDGAARVYLNAHLLASGNRAAGLCDYETLEEFYRYDAERNGVEQHS